MRFLPLLCCLLPLASPFLLHPPIPPPSCLSSTPVSTPVSSSTLSSTDQERLNLAISAASTPPIGATFPNPPVGCTIYSSTGTLLGTGFHPLAGFPHAEVFALLEAVKLVPTGSLAATATLHSFGNHSAASLSHPSATLTEAAAPIPALLDQYKTAGASLFTDAAVGATAYVTLEPCSHHGLTPPCCESLVAAGVSRVVVGSRDPNPKVDGGGVKFLQEAGVEVTVVDAPEADAVAALFLRRMRRVNALTAAPREPTTGKRRRELRADAGRMKVNNKMLTLQLPAINPPPPSWLYNLDEVLWAHDLVSVDCGRHVGNRKACEARGMEIAAMLDDVEVVQCVGHKVLMHRPKLGPENARVAEAVVDTVE